MSPKHLLLPIAQVSQPQLQPCSQPCHSSSLSAQTATSARGNLPVSMLAFHKTSPCLSSAVQARPVNRGSLASSPVVPLPSHHQHRQQTDTSGTISKLTTRVWRLNEAAQGRKKCSLEKLFPRQASLETMTTAARAAEKCAPGANGNCSAKQQR
ncbi:1-phosphatidylinositol 4,5-bisphosphate phosphodiesterase epsilon-1 isoform X1 [Lates japonicus]|uniref:1-phosphatidylinositol 4,5-bisphosphate phosphodiesterase epsilon-1 isoform X1 n=1 Tax=Lates japonicus TaxID=270547 RepID=A0AAD3RA86_LATJO|nr:1-phosphatidylinositol 4,5-bisphosphate phosphodiesterase epsilon-1 isoform X1 [Lates japonicus]